MERPDKHPYPCVGSERRGNHRRIASASLPSGMMIGTSSRITDSRVTELSSGYRVGLGKQETRERDSEKSGCMRDQGPSAR